MKTFSSLYSCLFSILFLSILTGGCKEKNNKPVVAPPVKVTVQEISPSSEQSGVGYSGTVSSQEAVNVSFSVAGVITELYAKEGQKVNKGQLLGKIRSGEYQNAYNIAQAQLAEAQDGYDRLKKLHDANALPDVKWVEIQQKLIQAQNAAEMTKRTLEDANLHSPVSGTVTRKYSDVGQTVMPIEPVFEIVATDDLTIDIPVSESEIGNFQKGENAKITIAAAEIGELEGKVVQKSVVADPLTRSYTVKISLPNKEGKILPGMIGTVIFDNKMKSDSVRNIVLPSQAVLLNSDNRWFVWVVKDSVAQRRFVEADELVANGVVITSGLQKGDLVIVEGMQKVGSGSKVRF